MPQNDKRKCACQKYKQKARYPKKQYRHQIHRPPKNNTRTNQ